MMTQEQLVKRFLAGEPLRVVEYRSTTAETISWTDKQTGKRMSAPVCKHAVEAGDVQITVSERLEDGTDVTKIKGPFAKGTRCVLVYNSQERVQGAHRAQGLLEPLESVPASR